MITPAHAATPEIHTSSTPYHPRSSLSRPTSSPAVDAVRIRGSHLLAVSNSLYSCASRSLRSPPRASYLCSTFSHSPSCGHVAIPVGLVGIVAQAYG